MTVGLTERECWMLTNLCAIRCLNLRNKNTISDNIWDVNYICVLSEYAWSKKLNLHYNLTSHIENDSSDFRSGDTTYDIKSTRRKDGNLLVNPNKLNSNIYVLAIVTERHIQFIGWKQREDLYHFTVGNHKMFGCEKNQLNSWQEH